MLLGACSLQHTLYVEYLASMDFPPSSLSLVPLTWNDLAWKIFLACYLLETILDLQLPHFWTLMMVNHTLGVPPNHDIVRSHLVQWHPLHDQILTHENCKLSLNFLVYSLARNTDHWTTRRRRRNGNVKLETATWNLVYSSFIFSSSIILIFLKNRNDLVK